MKTLLKNGTLVNPKGQQGRLDLLMENGVITEIAENIQANDAVVVDATGKTVCPGFFDMHVHFREPGQEYKETIETGAMAAVAGGFTGVACMPNTSPVVDNQALVRYILEKADQAHLAKVYPIACITKGMQGKELTEMGLLQEAGAIAFSDDGKPVENSRIMKLALQYAKQFDALLISHCEDKALAEHGVMNLGKTSTMLGLPGIPSACEDVMIARELILAEMLHTKVHIAHVSTKTGCQLIREAKARGVKVTAETAPHYLVATDALVESMDTSTKVNPPLREEADRQAIIRGVMDGTLDVIITDHAPHHVDDKDVEYNSAANGIVGLETSFALSYTELVVRQGMPLERLVEAMSVRPHEILGLAGGVLAKGKPADVTVVDLSWQGKIDKNTFYSKGRNTPFDGWQVQGRVTDTFVDGRHVYQNGAVVKE